MVPLATAIIMASKSTGYIPNEHILSLPKTCEAFDTAVMDGHFNVKIIMRSATDMVDYRSGMSVSDDMHLVYVSVPGIGTEVYHKLTGQNAFIYFDVSQLS